MEEAERLLKEIKKFKPNSDSKILAETETTEAHL
ncbi:hypothetical protein J2Z52_002775 [Enterococcus rivorum]|nr:hypothetical protein [Enterococcus rivorum]